MRSKRPPHIGPVQNVLVWLIHCKLDDFECRHMALMDGVIDSEIHWSHTMILKFIYGLKRGVNAVIPFFFSPGVLPRNMFFDQQHRRP